MPSTTARGEKKTPIETKKSNVAQSSDESEDCANAPLGATKKRRKHGSLLKDEFPEVFAEIKPELHPGEHLDEITSYSDKKVKFHCETCDYTWTNLVRNLIRLNDRRCPRCIHPLLKTKFPELFAQLKPELNSDINLDELTAHSHAMVQWTCDHVPTDPKCQGHVWPATVYSRTGKRHSGCPFCSVPPKRYCKCSADKLMGCRVNLMLEFDRKKNKNIPEPENLPLQSHQKIWWVCQAHKTCKKHKWHTSIKCRTDGSGCPRCAVGTQKPCGCSPQLLSKNKLSLEIDVETNAKHNIDTSILTNGSTKEIYWKCARGHSWQAIVNSRTLQGTGCSICNDAAMEPEMEREVKRVLCEMGIAPSKQHKFADCRNKRVLKWDFFLRGFGCRGVLIETDGPQHFAPSRWFSGDEAIKKFNEQQKRDGIKNIYTLNRYHFLRISYSSRRRIETEILRFLKDVKLMAITEKPLFRCVGNEYETEQYKSFGCDFFPNQLFGCTNAPDSKSELKSKASESKTSSQSKSSSRHRKRRSRASKPSPTKRTNSDTSIPSNVLPIVEMNTSSAPAVAIQPASSATKPQSMKRLESACPSGFTLPNKLVPCLLLDTPNTSSAATKISASGQLTRVATSSGAELAPRPLTMAERIKLPGAAKAAQEAFTRIAKELADSHPPSPPDEDEYLLPLDHL